MALIVGGANQEINLVEGSLCLAEKDVLSNSDNQRWLWNAVMVLNSKSVNMDDSALSREKMASFLGG
jgi:hypothetical protein